jgi:hypothetical protein
MAVVLDTGLCHCPVINLVITLGVLPTANGGAAA